MKFRFYTRLRDSSVLGVMEYKSTWLSVSPGAARQLAVGMNEPGREIEGAMAVVPPGGLLTSMTLNLLVLPTLALRYGRFVVATTRDELAVAAETDLPRSSPSTD